MEQLSTISALNPPALNREPTTAPESVYGSVPTTSTPYNAQKSRYAEYKLIDGAAPALVVYGGGSVKQSELVRVRNISLSENSIVLSSANGSFEAAAISLNYEGTRVKSALIGRDLNPMGRGDGIYYFAGAMSTTATLPNLGTNHHPGTGNSVNNCGQCGGGKAMNLTHPIPKITTDENCMNKWAEDYKPRPCSFAMCDCPPCPLLCTPPKLKDVYTPCMAKFDSLAENILTGDSLRWYRNNVSDWNRRTTNGIFD